MRFLTLADGSAVLPLPDRPTGTDFPSPLPCGLSLDDAVAVRAHEVKAGDLVVYEFPDGTGVRRSGHVPVPFSAAPHTITACPCEWCEECEDLEAWTLGGHDRVADVDWRFLCLAPSDDDEPCAIMLRNQPVAVIPAGAVKRAEEAVAELPTRTYHVTWRADFEASSVRDAALLAYRQLKGYADADSWPPQFEVTDESGRETVVDLFCGEGEDR
ncbi:hypothetical protein ACQEVS_10225 [Streptomyces sp. CA-181903]|uniref:hypothetical protein n=1 Tax=Streptomyces sp. CA-181903 TaxID=3240055 RepID=UPI003D91CF3C